MTSKKRTNNKTIKAKPAPQVSGGVSFSQAVSWVSLLGAAVQLYLSLKILVSDKEFATLALSFVFFLVFVVLYFFFSRKVIYGKKEIFIDLSFLAVASLILFIAFLFTGVPLSTNIFLLVFTLLLDGCFPLVSFFLCSYLPERKAN